MERRAFLTLAGAAAGVALGAPHALAFFEDDEGPRHPHAPDIVSEFAVAKSMGKPLLVFVRPHVPRGMAGRDGALELSRRMRAFSAWLYHGDTESMAQLALCQVTSAPMAEVRAALPELVGHFEGEPWMLLIETGELEPRVQRMDMMPRAPGQLADFEDKFFIRGEDVAKQLAKHHTTQLDAWLALALDEQRLVKRANEALEALGVDDEARVRAALKSPGDEHRELFWRAAAATTLYAEQEAGDGRDVLVGVLATESILRLRRSAPRGTHWGTSGGCGSRTRCAERAAMEAQRRRGTSCGRGYVPAISRNFLELLVDH